MKNKLKAILLGLLLVVSLVAAGCTGQDGTSEEAESMKTYVVLGDPGWDDSRANTQVLKQILESTGNYEVEIVNADLGAIYQGVAQGEIDAYVSAWLPHTQGQYWEKYEDKLDYVGNISTGAKIGLVVPSYVTIDSIAELNSEKEKFGGIIQGIEPGAGIMQTTETAIEEYELDYKLSAASTVGMVTELQRAINNEEWIVVTLWSPHWAFSRMDLKYLDDPKGAFGGSDNIVAVAPKTLKVDKPELYEIISRYTMNISDIEAIMLDIDKGMTPEEAAAKWLEENPEKYNEVLGTE